MGTLFTKDNKSNYSIIDTLTDKRGNKLVLAYSATENKYIHFENSGKYMIYESPLGKSTIIRTYDDTFNGYDLEYNDKHDELHTYTMNQHVCKVYLR